MSYVITYDIWGVRIMSYRSTRENVIRKKKELVISLLSYAALPQNFQKFPSRLFLKFDLQNRVSFSQIISTKKTEVLLFQTSLLLPTTTRY